ncbi:DUF58 domain-containing protein [Methylophilus aquaticus]|uniref:DUF58 domain-containing protein n=1 Tax=Methylophilus aquaticus TaxID=1971610 RepID=A0ABT9JQC9_9PROT|nr:DUF58 domain-containing protein [Methylophilus aquaticus]MDP8566758.1 DUF58 domain-containing protein [Methylophilus aquaticus]
MIRSFIKKADKASEQQDEANYARPFEYVIGWKSDSIQLGDHSGTQRGLGSDYRGIVNLVDYPDARRMDIRQTIRDPFEQVQVRQFNQDSTTPIYAVCDLSSSMQFRGRKRKLDTAVEIATAVAHSAYNAGDLFGFIGYNQQVIEDFTLPLSRNLHQSKAAIALLHDYQQLRIGVEGVTDVPNFLGQTRALVFWISDFHMPLSMIEKTLLAMSTHKVIPIVLWDDEEYKKLPKFGFGTMIDLETGLNRTLFFRSEVKAKFLDAFNARRLALEALFLRFDSPALFMQDDYRPELMTHYFEQAM